MFDKLRKNIMYFHWKGYAAYQVKIKIIYVSIILVTVLL